MLAKVSITEEASKGLNPPISSQQRTAHDQTSDGYEYPILVCCLSFYR
jgi:hypothetical protein